MEKVLSEMPRISVFTDVLTDEESDYYVKKYSELGMNPDAGLESREQTNGQITEEVEQRSIVGILITKIESFLKNVLQKQLDFQLNI